MEVKPATMEMAEVKPSTGVDLGAQAHGQPMPEGVWAKLSDEKGNLKFVNAAITYPCSMLAGVISVCVFMTIIFAMEVSQVGVSGLFSESREYDAFDIRSVRIDSMGMAIAKVGATRDEDTVTTQRRQSENVDFTYWIYEAETDAGLLTPSNLGMMHDAEGMFTSHAEYDDWCLREYETLDADSPSQCQAPMTVLKMYYAASWDTAAADRVVAALAVDGAVQRFGAVGFCVEFYIGCEALTADQLNTDIPWAAGLVADMDAVMGTWDGTGPLNEDIPAVTQFAAYMTAVPTRAFHVDFFFDVNFGLDNLKTKYSRSLVLWGGPLDGYDTIYDREDVQGDLLKDHIMTEFYDEMTVLSDYDHSDDMNAYYFMRALIFDVFINIILGDMTLAMLSVGVVFFYLRFMIGSWFLATVGMLEIVLSLPTACFIMRTIFQVEYFGGMNALCLFVVAAIGADDIFVFMDAYRQSAFEDASVLVDLPTRMSWVYRRSGMAMFTTSCTTCAAFLCTVGSPIPDMASFGIFAAFVILMDYLLVMTLFCTATIIYHNRFEKSKNKCCPCPGGSCGQYPAEEKPTALAYQMASGDGTDTREPDRITAFFKFKFTDFILNPKARLGIFVVYLAWMIPAIISAASLTSTTRAEQFLDNEHPLQKAISILDTGFPVATDDEGLEIFFPWGTNLVDRTGVNFLYDPLFLGEFSYDKAFSFTPECQVAIKDQCADLRLNADYTALIKRDEQGMGTVKCVVEDLEAWTNGTAYDFPIPLDQVPAALQAFWTTGFDADDVAISEKYDGPLGWDGSNIQYVAISVEAAGLDPWGIDPYEETVAEYEKFENLVAKMNAGATGVCGTTYQTDLGRGGGGKWVFMNNQVIYSDQAVQGAVVGLCIAFFVILVATRLPQVAVFACMSIASTLISVVGAMTMIWGATYDGATDALDTTFAVLITILAGFSVDYVVHLAHAFVHKDLPLDDRIREAFGEMGVTVMSGMLTSVLASLPLFACKITFFVKFGQFLCLTIAFSWLFANFGFMSLLATFGHSPASFKVKYGMLPQPYD